MEVPTRKSTANTQSHENDHLHYITPHYDPTYTHAYCTLHTKYIFQLQATQTNYANNTKATKPGNTTVIPPQAPAPDDDGHTQEIIFLLRNQRSNSDALCTHCSEKGHTLHTCNAKGAFEKRQGKQTILTHTLHTTPQRIVKQMLTTSSSHKYDRTTRLTQPKHNSLQTSVALHPSNTRPTTCTTDPTSAKCEPWYDSILANTAHNFRDTTSPQAKQELPRALTPPKPNRLTHETQLIPTLPHFPPQTKSRESGRQGQQGRGQGRHHEESHKGYGRSRQRCDSTPIEIMPPTSPVIVCTYSSNNHDKDQIHRKSPKQTLIKEMPILTNDQNTTIGVQPKPITTNTSTPQTHPHRRGAQGHSQGQRRGKGHSRPRCETKSPTDTMLLTPPAPTNTYSLKQGNDPIYEKSPKHEVHPTKGKWLTKKYLNDTTNAQPEPSTTNKSTSETHPFMQEPDQRPSNQQGNGQSHHWDETIPLTLTTSQMPRALPYTRLQTKEKPIVLPYQHQTTTVEPTTSANNTSAPQTHPHRPDAQRCYCGQSRCNGDHRHRFVTTTPTDTTSQTISALKHTHHLDISERERIREQPPKTMLTREKLIAYHTPTYWPNKQNKESLQNESQQKMHTKGKKCSQHNQIKPTAIEPKAPSTDMNSPLSHPHNPTSSRHASQSGNPERDPGGDSQTIQHDGCQIRGAQRHTGEQSALSKIVIYESTPATTHLSPPQQPAQQKQDIVPNNPQDVKSAKICQNLPTICNNVLPKSANLNQNLPTTYQNSPKSANEQQNIKFAKICQQSVNSLQHTATKICQHPPKSANKMPKSAKICQQTALSKYFQNLANSDKINQNQPKSTKHAKGLQNPK